MRPEFYADNFRRYNTFIKNYARGGNAIYRVACGPNDDDYDWTDTVMKIAGKQMNGLSLHYYTIADRRLERTRAPPRSSAGTSTSARSATRCGWRS